MPRLTRTPAGRAGAAACEGSIVLLDLDRLGDLVRELGLSRYRPNDITGALSALVEGLARRWSGVVVYGLDWERGTEEAVIEVPGVQAQELEGDLVGLAEEVCRLGASITIVALTSPLTGAAGGGRAYREPFRRRAKRVMEAYKRRGGGFVVVDGSVVWRRLDCRGRAPG